MAATRRVTRAAGVVGLLAGGLLVAALLAEGTLRVLAATGNRLARQVAAVDPYAIKIEPHGAFGYRQRPGAVLEYANGTRATANAQGFRGPTVKIPKPAGVYRVILLGESSTHGWYVSDSQTIDAYMRQDLAAARPELKTEVANLAYDGYDAYQMLERLTDDGVALAPDAIIVNAGVNDVRNARFPHLGDPDPRTLIWEADLRRLRLEHARGGPSLRTRVKHWLFLARLPGVVRENLARRRAGSGPGGAVSAQGPYPDAADNFEKNLARIADAARRLRVPLLLSTPPSALRLPDAPASMPPRDYWIRDAATTQRYRDTLAARLRGLAVRLAAAGQSVHVVGHTLQGRMFLDDVHLTPEGNRAMAADFTAALGPLLPRKAAPPRRR